MAYQNVVTVSPEEGIAEEWRWETDLQTSYDGSESAVALLRYPKRVFSGTIVFDDVADIRRQQALMFRSYMTPFYFPLFQYGVKLKAAAAIAATAVTVNALRGDFRVGDFVLLIDGDTYETRSVSAVTSTTITFTAGLTNAYSKRAIVCPLRQVLTTPLTSFTRRGTDGSAKYEFKVMDYDPREPFLDTLNAETLTTYDSLTVLDEIPYGAEFESSLNTGLLTDENLSRYAIATPFTQSKITYALRFLCNRLLDPTSWHKWMKFADTMQGSNGTFLLPTNREDLAVVTPVAAAGTQVLVSGHDYANHYWGLDTFARIAIHSDEGTHYAKITAVAAIGANDRLTFTPAVPSGAGWASNQTISFMLKLRIADDKIVCTHYNSRTEVALSVRTVS